MKRKSDRQHSENPNLFYCPKCGEYKDKIKFHYDRNSKYGISSYCKKCMQRPKIQKYCIICNKPFETHNTRIKWCSDECKIKNKLNYRIQYSKKKLNPKEIIEFKCAFCEKPLEILVGYKTGGIRGRRYCSDKCRHKANNEKGKTRYLLECIICGNKFRSWTKGTKTCSKGCLSKHLNGNKIEVYCPVCKKIRLLYEKAPGTKGKIAVCESCYAKKANKQYRKTHEDKTSKKRNRKKVIELTDGYVRGSLRYMEIITPEMIELKRQQIKMRRTLKKFKQWRKQNESNNSDVYGKQCQDEENHERKFQYQ